MIQRADNGYTTSNQWRYKQQSMASQGASLEQWRLAARSITAYPLHHLASCRTCMAQWFTLPLKGGGRACLTKGLRSHSKLKMAALEYTCQMYKFRPKTTTKTIKTREVEVTSCADKKYL